MYKRQTNIQLIKTFVTALGGDAAAQSQGGYPGGYITIGNMLGLLKGKACLLYTSN